MRTAQHPHYTIPILAGLIPLLLACRNHHPIPEKAYHFTIRKDSALLVASSGFDHFEIIKTGDKEYLSFYDQNQHAIAFTDLETGKEAEQHKVYLPSLKGTIKSYYYHKPDSIFLVTSYSISLFSKDSGILFSKIINAPDSEEWPPVIYGNFLNTFPIFFDSIDQTLFIRQHCGPCGTDTSFYRTSILAAYKPGKDSILDLGIPFPSKYNRNYYGDAFGVYRTLKGDSLLLSFEGDEKIFIYKRNDGKLFSLPAKSSYEQQPIRPLPFEFHKNLNVRTDHLIESPLYLKIMYDPYRKLFYRLFLTAKPLKRNDGQYSVFHDKELIVMIFNEHLEKLEEINLGNTYNWYYSFVGKKGLYLKKKH